MATLITNFEVVRYCKAVGKSFPTHYFDIPVEEETIFCEFLGEDFYPILIADLVDHSDAVEWVEGTTYALNAKVIYEGCVFISSIANNTNFPTVETAWTEANKFTTTEYNNLWTTGHLRGFLAYSIAKTGLVPSTWKIGATGVRENFDESTRTKTADKPIFSLVSSEIHDGVVKRMTLLKKYICNKIEDNTTSSFYSEVGFYSDVYNHRNSDPVNRKTRGIFYRY